MRTVNEVSKLTGVSIRALQYYDKIGLLAPSGYTASGYRLYDDSPGNAAADLTVKRAGIPLKGNRKDLIQSWF